MLTVNSALLETTLETLLTPRVQRYTALLREKLNHEGTGLLHVGNVNRSSTPSEYPAVQLANLRDSLGFARTGPLTWQVGSFASNNAQGYAEAEMLNNKPVSRGGRRWVTKAFHDPELQTELMK